MRYLKLATTLLGPLIAICPFYAETGGQRDPASKRRSCKRRYGQFLRFERLSQPSEILSTDLGCYSAEG
jgi:hypothetical protein